MLGSGWMFAPRAAEPTVAEGTPCESGLCLQNSALRSVPIHRRALCGFQSAWRGGVVQVDLGQALGLTPIFLPPAEQQRQRAECMGPRFQAEAQQVSWWSLLQMYVQALQLP